MLVCWGGGGMSSFKTLFRSLNKVALKDSECILCSVHLRDKRDTQVVKWIFACSRVIHCMLSMDQTKLLSSLVYVLALLPGSHPAFSSHMGREPGNEFMLVHSPQNVTTISYHLGSVPCGVSAVYNRLQCSRHAHYRR